MKTAKELAFKAYCDAFTTNSPKNKNMDECKDRFETWWNEYFSENIHKEGFYPKHKVFIDGKKYIQAE